MEYRKKRDKQRTETHRDHFSSSIRQAIDVIFTKYDLDRNGSLDINETRAALKDSFMSIGSQRSISQSDVELFLQSVDINSDGRISKEELFLVFKKAIGSELQTGISIS